MKLIELQSYSFPGERFILCSPDYAHTFACTWVDPQKGTFKVGPEPGSMILAVNEHNAHRDCIRRTDSPV